MKRTAAVLAVFAVLSACADSHPVTPNALRARGHATILTGDVLVTNSNDAGSGSFRDAIAQASSDASIASIAFLPGVGTIRLQSSVTYTGTQDLSINGNHATLDASAAGGSAFVANSTGGDLELSGLTVHAAAGAGVQVNVLPAATGVVRIVLMDVDITDNAGHGFLVNDQTDPLSLDANGSDASVDVEIAGSRFLRNGFSASDRDGIRINEGGPGDLTFAIRNSVADGNAADGIELDERGGGNVVIDVFRARVTRNGIFDPEDLDDGFDIDEAGDGSILGQIVSSSANHNFEEGLDINENDAGDLRVDLVDVDASYNREEGIDCEEDDDVAGGGDLVTVMDGVRTIGNGADGGDGGLKIREKGAGDLDVSLANVIASQNLMAGVHLRETEAGDARVRITKAVTNTNAADSGPGDGIEIREGSSGSITLAELTDITTSGNARFGVSAENGTVILYNVKGGGNASGLTGGGATFVVLP